MLLLLLSLVVNNRACISSGKGKVVSFDGSEINVNAQTICIHSDTPNALDIAKEVNQSII